MMKVINADCITGMGAELEDNSIDAIVTDPPYGLSRCSEKDVREALNSWLTGNEYQPKGKGFMGKSWDAFVPGPEVWRECLRVLKPGGHMAVFAGSRTVDLMGIAVRLAGFEVRDQLQWIYGSGFPKSTRKGALPGWGTALKPAHEPIILARKPLIGTVAKNVEEYGTGGINVDGCRIDGPAWTRPASNAVGTTAYGDFTNDKPRTSEGRWPANVILDEEAGALLDEQSGVSKPKAGRRGRMGGSREGLGMGAGGNAVGTWPADPGGGASRFFYCPKASKKEREAGLENFDPQRRTDGRESELDNPRLRTSERRNAHPTVKPIALMQWLSRLICPPNGIILDPFTGSGSTGCAAKAEGFEFVGFELNEEYCNIARARIAHTSQENNK